MVRRVLDDSFIITRDSAGAVRALFNMCRHSGMPNCAARKWETRRTSGARTTAGRTATTAAHRPAVPPGGLRRRRRLARTGHALLPAPGFASYNGLLFVSLDPHAPPLEDFLGDFRFYLDFYTKQSAGGLELHGPQRWRIKANWKIGAENFAGDMYHTPHTHASIVDIGLFREPARRSARTARNVLGGPRRRNHLQAPAGRLRRTDALRRLPRRDDRPDQGGVVAATAAGRRRGRFHDLGRHLLFPTLVQRQLLAEAARRRPRERASAAVHLDPALAADQQSKNRGVLVVRRGLRGSPAVQKGLVPRRI